jgi:hypothetical protein
MKPEIAEAIASNKPILNFHHIQNYGDFLNVMFFRKLFGRDICFVDCKAIAEIPPDVRVFMGIGTLIGYILPDNFFRGRRITFLGTGAVARVRSNEFFRACDGFTRGLLTETVTGVKAGGDPFLLLDRVLDFRRKTPQDSTAAFVNKYNRVFHLKLPKPVLHKSTVQDLEGITKVYEILAQSRYVVTDRLHIAVTAESMHVPWVLWNHRQGDLADHSEKFLDWAHYVKKADFVVTEERDLGKVVQNTDFEYSESQKDLLFENLQNVTQTLR